MVEERQITEKNTSDGKENMAMETEMKGGKRTSVKMKRIEMAIDKLT